MIMSCSKFVKPNISGVNAYSCHFNDNVLSQDCSTAPDSGFLAPHNVKRCEGRAKARIKSLQGSLKSFKRTHKANNKKIEVLQAALDDTRSLVSERNSEIGELKREIQKRDQIIDSLTSEKEKLCEQSDGELAKYHAEVASLQEQLSSMSKITTLPTFSKRKYNASIRELYYSLLAMRIPPAQIKTVVTNVISCLNPSADIDGLRLPGKSCAAYMRSQEMPTISRAQKANELMQKDQWLLNSDGTTLMQQKKVAFLINGIVFGVHDVPDGASQTTLDALQAELAKTGSVAAEAFPWSNHNFTIDHIISSTSDSASTQTKLAHLLEKETGYKIVDNRCAMHLGVNLRAAQVKAAAKFTSTGIIADQLPYDGEESQEDILPSSCSVSESSESDYEESESALACSSTLNRDIDLFVHELVKLFGHLGTPEYCHGSSTFRVFLEHKVRESSEDDKEYYLSAQKVVLERQVGSRYYVTSCNAGRLYFLCKAMIEFLKEQTLIKALNHLESTCLKKLHDSLLLTNLRLEGLMFDKVYADLMTLVKSADLNKTAIEMSSHYEELLNFFGTLITEPSEFLDSDMQVFKSESLLYGESSKLNHRLRDKYIPVRNTLYENCESDESLLFPLVSAVSTAMHSKLQQYMKDYLPGGRYHNPDPSVRSVLSELQPHNDRSESVLGCNDWLSKILPNMAQSTRSTMIEFSLNNTMKWLKEQGEKQKQALLTLAQEQRRAVLWESREDAKYVFERKLEQRSKAIELAHAKIKEKEKMIQAIQSHHVITSIAELDASVANITSLSIPKSLQDTELRQLVKTQKLLRTLVFNQKGVNLSMSAKGKPRPVSELLKDLATIISTKPVRVRRKDVAQAHQQLFTIFKKPSLLKGVHIKHRFEEDGELKWYDGIFTRINKKEAMVSYDGSKEEYHFSLEEIKEDFFSGDLVIL